MYSKKTQCFTCTGMALSGLDNHTAQPPRRVQEAAVHMHTGSVIRHHSQVPASESALMSLLSTSLVEIDYCRQWFCNSLDQIGSRARVFDIESGELILHKLHRRPPARECARALDSCGYSGRRALGPAAIVVRQFSASPPSFPIPIRTCPLCVLHSHAGGRLCFATGLWGLVTMIDQISSSDPDARMSG